jgi:CheY-like chemotaxis protein
MAERVLLIDDNPEIRTVLGIFLASFGYQVDESGDGAEGLGLAQQGCYDLVIADILMPGLSGWEVAEAIRGTVLGTPVVLITGLAIDEVVQYAQARGFALLLKPFSSEELARAVAAATRSGSQSISRSRIPRARGRCRNDDLPIPGARY